VPWHMAIAWMSGALCSPAGVYSPRLWYRHHNSHTTAAPHQQLAAVATPAAAGRAAVPQLAGYQGLQLQPLCCWVQLQDEHTAICCNCSAAAAVTADSHAHNSHLQATCIHAHKAGAYTSGVENCVQHTCHTGCRLYSSQPVPVKLCPQL
jgi:hypothetical protein